MTDLIKRLHKHDAASPLYGCNQSDASIFKEAADELERLLRSNDELQAGESIRQLAVERLSKSLADVTRERDEAREEKGSVIAYHEGDETTWTPAGEHIRRMERERDAQRAHGERLAEALRDLVDRCDKTMLYNEPALKRARAALSGTDQRGATTACGLRSDMRCNDPACHPRCKRDVPVVFCSSNEPK